MLFDSIFSLPRLLSLRPPPPRPPPPPPFSLPRALQEVVKWMQNIWPPSSLSFHGYLKAIMVWHPKLHSATLPFILLLSRPGKMWSIPGVSWNPHHSRGEKQNSPVVIIWIPVICIPLEEKFLRYLKNYDKYNSNAYIYLYFMLISGFILLCSHTWIIFSYCPLLRHLYSPSVFSIVPIGVNVTLPLAQCYGWMVRHETLSSQNSTNPFGKRYEQIIG